VPSRLKQKKKRQKKKKKNTNTNHTIPKRARGKTITIGSTRGNKNFTALVAGRGLTSINTHQGGTKRAPTGRREAWKPPSSKAKTKLKALSVSRKREPLSL
jgi:hypothetical protein